MSLYPEFNKSSALGDTVAYKGKYYKVIPADEGGRTINLNLPIKIDSEKPNTKNISNPTIDKLANPSEYRPLSTTKFDQENPRVAAEREGTNLDKQNRAALVRTELGEIFNKNTRTAIFNALDMFDTALKNKDGSGKPLMSKEELRQIFEPPSSLPPGGTRRGGVAAKFSHLFPGAVSEETDIYENIDKLRSQINNKGAEFFVARTNNRTSNENWQKLNEDYESGKITLTQFNKKLEEARISNDASQNYLKQVLNRINTWKAKNENLEPIQRTLKQFKDFDYQLAMADISSLNLQDVKNWRIQSKQKIIENMMSNLKDNPEMKDQFGTPKFDKNGRLTGYSMDALYEELSNSFDASGNYNPNYILKTKYTDKYAEAKEKLEKRNKELYPEEFKKSGIPFLEKLYDMNKDDQPFDNISPGVASRAGLKFTQPDGSVIDWSGNVYDVEDWNIKTKLAKEAGLPTYDLNDPLIKKEMEEIDPKTGASTKATIYTPESLSRDFQKSFKKAVYNLYTDKDDRNILNIPTPFFEEVNIIGGTGLGAKALVKEINLADEKGDSPWIWGSFLADWERSKRGLEAKINGVDRKISFEGAGEYGYETDKETSDKGVRLINNFIKWAEENDTEANSFIMEAYRYANDNKNNSAMKIIKIPEKFLKKQLLGSTDTEYGEGFLTQPEYGLILKNGITILGKQGDFNNDLIKATRSNLQAHVDYNKYYRYNHPSGLASLEIIKDENGDYNMIQILKDPSSNQILTTTDYSTRFGDQLDNATVDAMQTIQNYINQIQSAGYTSVEQTEENNSGRGNRGYLTDFGL